MQQARVMTFNMRHGRGMDDRIDLERIAEVIRDSKADVVALNEVDRNTRRCGGVDQAQLLGGLLDMEAVYSPSIEYQGGQYGNALLTRLPVRSARVHALPDLGPEDRTLLHAELEWGEGSLHVLVTHLGLYHEEQRAQVKAIARVVNDLNGPTILAGDFNFDSEVSDLLKILPKTMRDAWTWQQVQGLVVAGPEEGWTFPSDRPRKRIDYILFSDDLQVKAPFVTIKSLASDHLPLVGTLALIEAPHQHI